MIQKVITAIVLSIGAQILGGYMSVTGFGIIGNTHITTFESFTGTLGQILFFGAPIAAALYIAKTYKQTKKRSDKKALIAMIIGVVIAIGALPVFILGGVLNEKISEHVEEQRGKAHQERLLKEDEKWKANQRNTVCVTKDNVSYDFEFAGLYNEYESAYFALRDNAPQSVRVQAADIIDNKIKPTYALCTDEKIKPQAEREQLKATFNDFIKLAEPYRD